jgi:hypothetical protein
VIANADCPIARDAGLDQKGHKLIGVCYESQGATSKIEIDAALNCHSSDHSVVSKLLGGKNAPSISENVTVVAEARGADCQLLSAEVKPSGELGKILAAMFDANGKAREALEKGPHGSLQKVARTLRSSRRLKINSCYKHIAVLSFLLPGAPI